MGRSEKRSNKTSKSFVKSSMHKRSRKSVHRFGNSETEQNYDHIFDMGNKRKDNPIIDNIIYSVNTDQSIANNAENSITDSSQGDSLSVKDVLPILSEMFNTIKFLTEKVNNASNEIRSLQNNPKLHIDDKDVTADELPLLRKFESFTMPIQEQNQLKLLEDSLKTDKTFFIFFVSE